MNEKSPIGRAEKARELARYVFIPTPSDETANLLQQATEPVERAGEALRGIAAAFRQNVEAVLAVVSLPYSMAYSAVMGRWLQYDYIKASLFRDTDSTPPEVAMQARRALEEDLKNRDKQELFIDELVSNLLQFTEHESFRAATRELHRQALVLTWGAIEVLAKDLFVMILNADPSRAVELMGHERTRRRFALKGIPLETLTEHAFDVSAKMGHVMISLYDLDSLPAIRDAFAILARDNETATLPLNDNELWLLYQRRHLIVHRRAIVDRDYLEKTGDKLAVGAELMVAPTDVQRGLNLAINVVAQLLGWASTVPELL